MTLSGLFLERVRRSPQQIAYRSFDKVHRAWHELSWQQIENRVQQWVAALVGESLATGERVALQCRNGVNWVVFEQAALRLGLVVVPIYVEDRPQNILYVLRDSGARLLLVESLFQYKRLPEDVLQCTALQRVVVMNPLPQQQPGLVSSREWLTAADLRQSVSCTQDSQAMATLVYTSGTTGKPKGVMLTHQNVLSNATACLQASAVYRGDLFLSFLPLSHMLERTVGYYVPMMAGATVVYARSIRDLAADLLTVKPTCLVAVPRIFERAERRIQEHLQGSPAYQRWLFGLAVHVGWNRFQRLQGRAMWTPLEWVCNPLYKRVVRKVLNRFGGRLRLVITGGAALPPAVAKTLIAMGLPLVQGYGMTECSPVATSNRLDKNRPESIGRSLEGVEVRVGEGGELQIRGASVMRGYWNNETATQEAFTDDGWLRSGDCTRQDEDGFWYITGRIKEIMVLTTGEKIPPMDIENAILEDPLFQQVMIVGEGRSYLALLAVVDGQRWQECLSEAGLASPVGREQINALLLPRVRARMSSFPGYAKIHQVCVDTVPWDTENGLLTPTLKLKRKAVAERYASEISAMYEGH
ncbi:MAG TPA: long-chain fatty acid--CoA ligase [Gammaproteobacteria bacterium]|nr:long-chain fatty acid--CoA ligase [Gammaproteobacteria bacterium]